MEAVSEPENLPSDAPVADIAPDTLDVVQDASEAPRPNTPAWLDLGPLLVFFAVFHILRRSRPDDAMLIAAGVFAVASVIALSFSWTRHGRVSGMLLLSTAIIVVTAGLALLSDNKIIFYMKPTIVNALFGVAAIGGALIGRNVIKLMVGNAFTLPERAWNGLAWRWGLFFFAMAAINEVVWRTMSEAFWVNFKVFGFLPLTLVFTVSLIPYIRRHGGLETRH